MANNKQILILEDLGIPKTNFHDLTENANFNYNLIWDETKVKPKQVVVLVNVKKKIDKSLLDKYPNVKMIAVSFTGYDSVDLEYCKTKNIAVYNVPAYATNSVSELVIGLVISLLREIPRSNKIIRSGKWKLTPGLELSGKTVGVLGTGKIGINTAKVFKALGCHIIGCSRTEHEEFKNLGGKYISDKKEFFAKSDIVSIHLPYNEDTENTVGEGELNAMKKTSYLINTARGPIVNEQALIGALQNKQIAGAGLDVFDEEPINRNNELLKLKNVVLTPHVAYKTKEALKRRAETTVNNIVDFTKNVATNRVE